MMRRARISVRPNVRPAARSLPSSQDGQSSPAAADTTTETKREGMPSVAIETTLAGNRPVESVQNTSPDMKETRQSFRSSGGGDAAVSALQRRKRFSALPNLAKPRVTAASTRVAARVTKSPPPKVSNLPPAHADVLPPKDNNTAHSPRSPRWRRASGGGKQSKTQGKLAPLSPSVPVSGKQAPLSSTAPAPGPVSLGRKEQEACVPLPCTKSDMEKSPPVEKPLPDPSPVSVVQSQSAKLEMKSPSSLPLAAQNIPSERERIEKLRELIKQEQRKQRKSKKGRSHICEHSIPQDHNKMTMRDLIYYLPDSNPMRSYPGEENKTAEKVIPPSPDKALPKKPQDLVVADEQQEDEEDIEGDGAAEEDQLVVPRVKVAEDGTLILDEESLTVEVLRTKGPNLAEENDPIFERGSSTTYSSFRKTVYTKPWSNKETEMFFLAIGMVGTDFSLIGELFPHRARTEIKNKFKKEERENSWRIDKAFKEKCRFDLECFSNLLERILAEEERKRKKSKNKDSAGQKKKASVPQGRKAAAKRAPRVQSAEEELASDVVDGDSEMAEKENEDCSNVAEAGANTTAAKISCKRKREGEETPHERSADGRSLKKSQPGAAEGGHSEDCEGSVCGTEPAASDVVGLKNPESSRPGRDRPAQLSGGRFQRPTPNLGARWAKKSLQPGGKGRDGDMEISSSKGDGLSTTQEKNQNKPTRREQNPAEKDDLVMESNSASPSRPKGVTAKGQGQQPAGTGRRGKPRPNLAAAHRKGRQGKPKLVTLRASLPEDNEEEEQEEAHPEEDLRYPINPEEQNQAPAFVPLSLRSPQPVPMEVVETVEELEISMNVSDVVDTAESEHGLCAQPVCTGVQDEVVVSTEHQLDLLVDVIEFLSPDHVAGSEDSYNDAARTLLTIRNPELLSLAAPAYSREIVITEESHHVQLEETEPSGSVSETVDQLQCRTEQPQMVPSDLPIAETSQCVHDMDSISLIPVEEFESETLRSESVSKTQRCETTSLEHTVVPEESHIQERAAPVSTGASNPKPSVQNVLPGGRRSRFPKPKPNLTQTARIPRVTPSPRTENPAVEPESLKTVETEKKSMDISPKKLFHGSQEKKDLGEIVLSQDKVPCVGDSQIEGMGSDLSNQSVPSAGRERHLPRASSILGTAVQAPRNTMPLSTPLAPSTEGQRTPSGATEGSKLAEQEACGSSANDMRAEMDKKNASVDQRTEGQAKANPLFEMEEENRHSSIASLKGLWPEDGGEKLHETSVSIDTEATSLHMDGDLSAAVSCQATEGQQPTFILTLFEVSPPLFGELDSGVDPPCTIAAKLLSPLVFVDEQLAPAAIQTESQSCDSVNVVASVEMGAECGPVPQPLASASEEQVEEWPDHSSKRGRTQSSTGVTSNSMASPVDSCGHLQVNPHIATQSPEDSAESDQTVFRTEHLLPTPDQTSPQASSTHYIPLSPTAQDTSTEGPAKPGPSTTPGAAKSPQGTVGSSALPELDRVSASISEGTESSGSGSEPQISHQTLPVTSGGLMTRTGRKPRGFLSFISGKSTTKPAGAPRSARPTCLRPQVNTSRTGRRAPTVSSPPSRASSANNQTAAKSPTSQACTSAEDESPSVKTSKTGTEPTSVSEYFFSDIFTQVEEPE